MNVNRISLGLAVTPFNAAPGLCSFSQMLTMKMRGRGGEHSYKGLRERKGPFPVVGCSISDGDPAVIFPRINTRDPYKRLGISREASEEEIQSARSFLIHKYSVHKPSVDAIEWAHNKIILHKFHERRRSRKPVIDQGLKKKIASQLMHFQEFVGPRLQTPTASSIFVQTSFGYLLLGVATLLFPTEGGPTLQVAVSFVMTLCFMHIRLKSNKTLAFLYGLGSFLVSWLMGTFLMVCVIPPLRKGPWSLEVTTSLATYVFLWLFSNSLK